MRHGEELVGGRDDFLASVGLRDFRRDLGGGVFDFHLGEDQPRVAFEELRIVFVDPRGVPDEVEDGGCGAFVAGLRFGWVLGGSGARFGGCHWLPVVAAVSC